MTRRTTLALLCCAALLASCSDDDGGRDGPDTRIQAGDEYVALGDSYTSAPEVGDETGPIGCLQTNGNYPHLVAERAELELTDASCGGATTADLVGSQTAGGAKSKLPPQVDAVTADTDLVTLSIGGNDGRAFGAIVTTCVALGQQDPDGAPCTEFAESDEGAYDKLYADLQSAIESALEKIRERAPQARVIVVGYPQIFPEKGTCEQLPLAERDYPLARELVEGLVGAQKKAASTAGVEFLDVRPATEGHDICSDDPWVAGITPEQGRPAAPYHPYAEEQQAVADLLAERIAEPKP